MNQLWPILLACLLALLGSRIVLANAKTNKLRFDGSVAYVQLRRRNGVLFLAAFSVIAPLPPIVTVLRTQGESPELTLCAVVLFCAASGAGLGLLAYCLRKIFVTFEGIRIEGLGKSQFAWAELCGMDASINGRIASIRFEFANRSIRVDSTFDGFRELLQALEVWPIGNAKALSDRVLRELAEWRSEPKNRA